MRAQYIGSQIRGATWLATSFAKGLGSMACAEMAHRGIETGRALRKRDVAAAVGANFPFSVMMLYQLRSFQANGSPGRG